MNAAPATYYTLSLFCGCGGLDLGFEKVGFNTALAYDRRPQAVSSWNRNRKVPSARVQDVREITLSILDVDFGGTFKPVGVVGGPPCQGFSLANRHGEASDPRNQLVLNFVDVAVSLHERNELDFVVMENVPALAGRRGRELLETAVDKLKVAGFSVSWQIMDAYNYGVPQTRRRLILVALNKRKMPNIKWQSPEEESHKLTVRDAIAGYQEPTYISRSAEQELNPLHENHLCMVPRSKKFFDGSLAEGYREKRSFKTLTWDKPSYTVSYGNREVHIHPNGKRRLSVFEAMKLQGFPNAFVLNGSMSSQITQVSEAVPPPLAEAIARSIANIFNYFSSYG